MSETERTPPSAAQEAPVDAERVVPLGAADLPLTCPRPGAPLWARHPRVFLDVTTTGEVTCPYCSAHYIFTGEAPKRH
ncbi:zinc-finger domain-containing protein [Rhodocyclus tenuis]|uniref:Zinc-finger domain-containing protein n=1 Tax=Rhodocyclus gracilis TaxID=2929842 RepID=A0ABX0WED8_9RHOO|nr:zinc-finger domain-containing protein [Rhodocyclus gracilis]MRD72568.1 zinc-finger domain-containing protein [Rhodocyclus gracilis]NJA88094.1 zinc-finger domain-containing protein [Rhodocyclus gracilis]